MRLSKFVSVSNFIAQKGHFIDTSFTLPEVYSSKPTPNRPYLFVQSRFTILVNLLSPIYCLFRGKLSVGTPLGAQGTTGQALTQLNT